MGLAWAKLKLILKIDFYRDLQSSWPFLNAAVDMRVACSPVRVCVRVCWCCGYTRTHTHTHALATHSSVGNEKYFLAGLSKTGAYLKALSQSVSEGGERSE